MPISELCIRRPIATALLALGLFLAGAVAFVRLPVAPLPRVDFPTIHVSARLPGADPTTMAATVAAPLERRLGEIAGVSEITSTSGQGSTSIIVQFDLNRDIHGAARDVQAAITASGGDLPVDLPSPPTYRKVNPADMPVMILAVTSDQLPAGRLYDASDTVMAQRISQLEGVAQVSVSGAEKPAVRIRANPSALAAMGLNLEDVRTAVAQANMNMPKGGLEGDQQAMTIGANDQLFTAAGYAPLVLRARNGAVVRLSAVASVLDSVENTRLAGWFNLNRAVLIIIQKQAEANVIDTVDRIKSVLPQLQAWMPPGTRISVLSDRTTTIRASVRDVELALIASMVLVVAVVFLSLGRLAPTLAACVTVPLSLAGTFGAMWLLGYSLDNISLMALTISVGFVVDDAIVMIENIARHVEDGETPFAAAIRGAREITFTVLSISVSLVAVFIPLLFMGGVIGRLFREFAVTLTVAIAVSAVVSICVTPMVYAHLTAGRSPIAHDFWGTRLLRRVQAVYERGLEWALAHQGIMVGVTLGTIALTVAMYVWVPKGFFPQQDTGLITGMTEARTDISFQAMVEKQQQVGRVILADPAVATMGSFVGSSGLIASGNQGRMFITLKPLSERDASADRVIGRLRAKLAAIEGVSVFLQAAQDIRIGGRSSKAQFQFVLWSESLDDLQTWVPRFLEHLRRTPGFADVSSDQDAAGQQVNVVVDRDQAARLNIDMQSVDAALQNAFSQRQISTIYTQRNQYHVVLEAEARDLEDPASLDRIFVKTTDGRAVRLGAIARIERGLTALSVKHQGQFPAGTLSFNLPEGSSLGEAAARLQAAGREIRMPPTIHAEFAGAAKAFSDSLRDQPILISAALLTIYIVLGILYENTLHPITILSTLPSAGIGALLALMLSGYDLSVISVIGVILLMGIVKKNGIMLVDFAIAAERVGGLTPTAAIIAACKHRFRPITMTTLAAVLGAVPLALGGGAGSEMRKPLGIAIVGGLILSQLVTLYTTPVVYLALGRLAAWRKGRAGVAPLAAPGAEVADGR